MRVLKILAKVLTALRIGYRYVKWLGVAGISNFWAAFSRSRLAIALVFYHVVYENLGAWTSLSLERIIVSIGTVLANADQSILVNTQKILSGQVTGISSIPVLLSILGAFSTLALYFRFGNEVYKRLEPTSGIVTRWGTIFLVYTLIVFSVSGVAGDPRLPFEGVRTLLANWQQIAGSTPIPGTGNASRLLNKSAV